MFKYICVQIIAAKQSPMLRMMCNVHLELRLVTGIGECSVATELYDGMIVCDVELRNLSKRELLAKFKILFH
jgi:hypothetical protein